MGVTPPREKPKPIKIFCGLIGSPEAIERVKHRLIGTFGEIDCESKLLKFDFTRYYHAEMGENLWRKWISFRPLRERGYLSLAKFLCVRIEKELSDGEKRRINIDPGYLDDAQVVLATTKNYSHRLYIGMGYYAEVTLIYRGGSFHVQEWTYPDYRIDEAISFFSSARNAYLTQIKAVYGTRS